MCGVGLICNTRNIVAASIMFRDDVCVTERKTTVALGMARILVGLISERSESRLQSGVRIKHQKFGYIVKETVKSEVLLHRHFHDLQCFSHGERKHNWLAQYVPVKVLAFST